MGTTYYHTVNRQITGQTKDGVRTHYLPDAFGSVTATMSDAGVEENTYRYKPYGEVLAKTGVAADPRFLWSGQRQARRCADELLYVSRFGHYSSPLASAVHEGVNTGFKEALYSRLAGRQSERRVIVNWDPACKKCGAGGDIIHGYPVLPTLCSLFADPEKLSELDLCLTRCNIEHNFHVSLICLQAFCEGRRKITCGDCPRDSLQSCPPNCGRRLIYIPGRCASTSCDTRDISICCNRFIADLRRECCCTGPYGGGFNTSCDDVSDTLVHELLHACDRDCAKHRLVPKDRFQRWVNCFMGCLKL